jgi:hypothetical protein
MLEKITGYTTIIETLKNKKGTNPGSLKLVSRTGNTEDNTIVNKKTIFTKTSGTQPFFIFFDAERHSGQTKARKYITIEKSMIT